MQKISIFSNTQYCISIGLKIPIKYLYYLLFIAIIDLLVYLVFNRLISIYTRYFVITEYFTSPIYLLYLILYYYIFKKVNFSLKQIIISYMFFLIGIFFMIYGLINYFCITEIRGNSNFTEYYCKDEEKENKGYINYFIHSYISIIIAILLMPILEIKEIFMFRPRILKDHGQSLTGSMTSRTLTVHCFLMMTAAAIW